MNQICESSLPISERLLTLAHMITEGHRLCDVGTDHGYVPIRLLLEGRIPSAIAMDINKGPLERAAEHVEQYGLKTKVTLRLSDGVHALCRDEADTVLIAGMGGLLMVRILTEGAEVLSTVPELILQPQSDLFKFRQYLLEAGYRITEERMVIEDGKYYPMMRVEHETRKPNERETYTEAELLYGKVSLQKDRELLGVYADRNLKLQHQILADLTNADQSDERIRERTEEVCHKIALAEEIKESLV